jgi:hypothetical protein
MSAAEAGAPIPRASKPTVPSKNFFIAVSPSRRLVATAKLILHFRIQLSVSLHDFLGNGVTCWQQSVFETWQTRVKTMEEKPLCQRDALHEKSEFIA